MTINASPEILGAAGYKNLAAKSQLDRTLTREEIAEVHDTARSEIDALYVALTTSDPTKRNATLDEHMADMQVRQALVDLIVDVWRNPGNKPPAVVPSNVPAAGVNTATTAPKEISDAAGEARTAVKQAFGSPGDPNYKEYLGDLRRVIAKFPGFEPSTQHDIGDAIYQSRTFNLEFINWLEGEAGKDSASLDTKAKGAGTFSFVWEKTSFESVDEKRKVIKAMLSGLAEAIVKPEIQAGYIERFLGKDVIKTAVITVGGTLLVGGVLVGIAFIAGKWILVKTLGGLTAAIAGAIGAGLKKGWIGTKTTVATAALGDGLKGRAARAVTGAAVGAVIDVSTGMPGIATVSGGVLGSARGKPIAGGSPSAAPGTTPATTTASTPAGAPNTAPVAPPSRELDLKKPIEKAAFDGILKDLYNQEVAQGTRPGPVLGNTDAIPQDFIDEVKAEVDPARSAEYQNRVARYIETLGKRPVPTGNTVKDIAALTEWQRKLDLAILGEKDLSRWEKWRGAPATTATAGDLQSRVAQAGLDMRSEKFTVGSNTYEINPAAKAPLEAIRSTEVEINEKGEKLKELEAAKKVLEARIALEGQYVDVRNRLEVTLPGEIVIQEGVVASAETQMRSHSVKYMVPADSSDKKGRKILDTASRDIDPDYQRDKSIFEAEKSKLASLRGEKLTLETRLTTIDTQLKSVTGKQTSNIARYGKDGIRVDATTGKMITSLSMEKLNDPVRGIKAQIGAVEGEIRSLEGNLNNQLRTLHAINSKVPATWSKAGIDITMPDGSRIRVSQLGALVENLGKAMAKK